MNRIYNYNPNIKLILILREPISRAFSQYNMHLNSKGKTLNDVSEIQIIKDFEKEKNVTFPELKENGNYFIIRGKYDEIIEYILSIFPRENVYIGIAEEIKNNKHQYYNEIFKILEKKLYQIYRTHNEKLYKILGRSIEIWEKYYENI